MKEKELVEENIATKEKKEGQEELKEVKQAKAKTQKGTEKNKQETVKKPRQTKKAKQEKAVEVEAEKKTSKSEQEIEKKPAQTKKTKQVKQTKSEAKENSSKNEQETEKKLAQTKKTKQVKKTKLEDEKETSKNEQKATKKLAQTKKTKQVKQIKLEDEEATSKNEQKTVKTKQEKQTKSEAKDKSSKSKQETEKKPAQSKKIKQEKQAKPGSKEKTKEKEQKEMSSNPEVTILEQSEEAIEEKNVIEEKIEENRSEIKVAKGLHRYTKVIVVVSILLVVAVAVFSTIFALMHKGSNKIVEGVSIKGINVSGLTREEAENKLNEVFETQRKKDITLRHSDFETVITPEQIEMDFKVSEAIDLAYSIGRTGKILKDNYDILNAKMSKIEINPAYSYSDELLTNFIVSTQGNLPDIVKQSSYSVDGSNLIIDKGQKGVAIEQEPLKKQIVEICSNFGQENAVIEMPMIEQQPDGIDLNKIRSEIYKEAKDAYYTQNPFTIYPHVEGVDFAVTIEEAQNLLDNSQEATVTIPLKITKPKVTTNQIGTEAFPDLLSTFSTTFSTSNGNRTTNIRLASNKINGVVLMPGEEFSYNKVVGQRTAAAGYKAAAAYSGGKVVNELGGGICQVSSTLYNTALRANLEIVKRSNHRFATGYVPLSTDATVSWGGPEFVFKNSRKYPIKIVSQVNGGKITVSIYGCKEEVEYEVVIQSQTIETIPMKTVYRTNTALPKGTSKTVQKGHGGYKSRAYRILKLNGTVVSKQLLSTDTYAQLETIIEQNP